MHNNENLIERSDGRTIIAIGEFATYLRKYIAPFVTMAAQMQPHPDVKLSAPYYFKTCVSSYEAALENATDQTMIIRAHTAFIDAILVDQSISMEFVTDPILIKQENDSRLMPFRIYQAEAQLLTKLKSADYAELSSLKTALEEFYKDLRAYKIRKQASPPAENTPEAAVLEWINEHIIDRAIAETEQAPPVDVIPAEVAVNPAEVAAIPDNKVLIGIYVGLFSGLIMTIVLYLLFGK